MATVEEYRQHIKALLKEHASHVWDDRIQAQTIFDTESDRHQLIYVGWRNYKRVYGIVLHVDIIEGKIWIQQAGWHGGWYCSQVTFFVTLFSTILIVYGKVNFTNLSRYSELNEKTYRRHFTAFPASH